MAMTAEQHLVMEQLMGCELTRVGKPRRTRRKPAETARLGLYTEHSLPRINPLVGHMIKSIRDIHSNFLEQYADQYPHYWDYIDMLTMQSPEFLEDVGNR